MKKFWMLVLCGALAACGQTTEDPMEPTCGAGERFNPIEGRCVAVPVGQDSGPDVQMDATPDIVEPPVEDETPDVPRVEPDMAQEDMPVEEDMPEADMDPPVPGELYVGSDPVFMPGSLEVEQIDLAQGAMGAPVAAKVWAPRAPGRYAVVVFQHGFILENSYYSQMLTHVASHGFVVVAPQMYAPGSPFGAPSSTDEATAASGFLGWVKTSLGGATRGRADAATLGLVGHSRGSKIIWRMMVAGEQGVSALVGLDPVDGTGGPLGGDTRVISGMFSFSLPTLIIGTGKGPEGFMACAPAGDNHEQFYGASPSPAYHIVATDHGHNDMLDPNSGCGFACSACSAGPDPTKMIPATGGWITAHMRAALQGVASATDAFGQTAPVASTFEQR